MHNFFVDKSQITGNKIKIVGDDYNHIKNVLRMNSGDKFFVSEMNEEKRYIVAIDKILENEVECLIVEEVNSTEPSVNLTIFQGIPKADKMELIIQKCTELGISTLYPVEMKYCIGKIKNERKIDRWNMIAESAAKQSKRTIIPNIKEAISFKEMIELLKQYDLAIIAYENEKINQTLKEVLIENKNAQNIAIVIGPEGGIAKEEADQLIVNGVQTATLGKRILRTETAAIATTAMIMYEYDL